LSPAPFEVSGKQLDDGVRLLTIHGELDLNSAPELEGILDEALAAERPSILIDLSDCEFIDSTGLALIVRAWQEVDNGDGEGRLVLCCPNSQVRRLLDITGLETSISLHDDVDAALAELRR
jgi:stage II sporulation protein AA (anti-sigma F factor antagonist)